MTPKRKPAHKRTAPSPDDVVRIGTDCPYCGSRDTHYCVISWPPYRKPDYAAYCERCGLHGPMRRTRPLALESWNRIEVRCG